ncbi:hypothetical protein M407DRAFT_8286 [Tulasnella calospora MUT 4182]|uniref:Uncharacterized protein n=1 Tax=Tulasnella calospora MUT 4182 TaxID=1051891 RepID=A0A0C3QGT3_9AGAM|nr:hypothetical protein M407DRAFT_8286 [Tulasnella calospora MUT 4182]
MVEEIIAEHKFDEALDLIRFVDVHVLLHEAFERKRLVEMQKSIRKQTEEGEEDIDDEKGLRSADEDEDDYEIGGNSDVLQDVLQQPAKVISAVAVRASPPSQQAVYPNHHPSTLVQYKLLLNRQTYPLEFHQFVQIPTLVYLIYQIQLPALRGRHEIRPSLQSPGNRTKCFDNERQVGESVINCSHTNVQSDRENGFRGSGADTTVESAVPMGETSVFSGQDKRWRGTRIERTKGFGGPDFVNPSISPRHSVHRPYFSLFYITDLKGPLAVED